MRVLGLDPGLRVSGWGLIDVDGSRLRYVASGAVKSKATDPIASRLVSLFDGLSAIITEYAPQTSAVEETFSNSNAASSLALGLARGVVILAPAKLGLEVAHYPPNKVKKAVVGAGKADKTQVQAMIRMLLPGVDFTSADAADALAVAICHAHLMNTAQRIRACS